MNEEKELTENTENKEYHFIGVVFENKKAVGPAFSGPCYNYKTTKDLKEGQVIEVPTRNGVGRAVVKYPIVDESTINFDLSLIREV